jgi:serine protease DegQ
MKDGTKGIVDNVEKAARPQVGLHKDDIIIGLNRERAVNCRTT